MRSLEQEPCVVIMAGGAGTRFWPLSTELSPKQFLRPDGEESLLQQSYSRADALTSADRILVLTSEHLADRVAAELPEIPRGFCGGDEVGGEACSRKRCPLYGGDQAGPCGD